MARASTCSTHAIDPPEYAMKLLSTVFTASLLALASSAVPASETPDISVHVLDQVHGAPAADVGVILEEQAAGDGTWKLLSRQATNAKGRVQKLLPQGTHLHSGVYRVTFETGAWFAGRGESAFFPSVPVAFRIDNPEQPYHIPLLLSPYGYATYRGN